MKTIRVFLIGLCALVSASMVYAAADFSLPDTEGTMHAVSDYAGKYVVLEWTNPDCPFVKKQYGSTTMQPLQTWAREQGVVWLNIASSAPGKQGHYDGAAWQKIIQEQGINATAVLLDPDGKVGKLYGAKTTPHMFVIDPAGAIIYAGAIDDGSSWDPQEIEQSHNYVRAALEESFAGEAVSVANTKPYGCSVKY